MNINELFQLAVDHYQAGNLIRAKYVCKDILKNKPEDFETLHLLGIINYDLENYESAQKHFQEAIGIDQHNTFAYYNLGNAYRKNKRYEDAIASYRKALRLNPDFSQAHWNLALSLLLIGDYSMAGKKQSGIVD